MASRILQQRWSEIPDNPFSLWRENVLIQMTCDHPQCWSGPPDDIDKHHRIPQETVYIQKRDILQVHKLWKGKRDGHYWIYANTEAFYYKTGNGKAERLQSPMLTWVNVQKDDNTFAKVVAKPNTKGALTDWPPYPTDEYPDEELRGTYEYLDSRTTVG